MTRNTVRSKSTNAELSVRRRLTGFAVAVVIAVGVGATIGAAVGPIDVGPSTPSSPTAPHDGH